MFGLFVRVLERGKFLYNKMVELVAEVEDGHAKTQTMQTADCRPCRLRTFFLILVFAFTFDSHIFSLWSQISVHRYISECLFMERPFYVTLAWYVTVDVL